MEFLVPEDQRVSATVTVTSKLAAITNIKNRLSEDELMRFENSCFGHFLKMDMASVYSGQLLHYLCCRRIKHKQDKEIWFNISGHPARFSIVEFAIMTGLRCGEWPRSTPEMSKNTVLKDKYFDGVRRLKLKEIKEVFDKMPEGEDRIKIAMVYFLNAVLLSNDDKVQIRLDTLSLANDLDWFNEYPWGHLSYDMTFRSFNKDFKNRYGEYKYTLYGFPWAIQFWAYEAFFSIGSNFAIHCRDIHPRMLNWSAPKKKCHTDTLEKSFRKLRLFDATLRATAVELALPYMRDVDYTKKTQPLGHILGMKRKITTPESNVEKSASRRKDKVKIRRKDKVKIASGKNVENVEKLKKVRKKVKVGSSNVEHNASGRTMTMEQLRAISQLKKTVKRKIEFEVRSHLGAMQTALLSEVQKVIAKEVRDALQSLDLQHKVQEAVQTAMETQTRSPLQTAENEENSNENRDEEDYVHPVQNQSPPRNVEHEENPENRDINMEDLVRGVASPPLQQDHDKEILSLMEKSLSFLM